MRHLSIRHTLRSLTNAFGQYKLVNVGNVSAKLSVPEHIPKPAYHVTGNDLTQNKIDIKSREDVEKMRSSCQLAASILKNVEDLLRPGTTTDEIDVAVHELCIFHEAYPSPLNYKGFPKSVCTSINNIACHGIPDDRRLEDGDIINVDVTVYINGFHGDCSKTYSVGAVDKKGRKLVEFTEDCLLNAIELCKPGVQFSTIGDFIETYARSNHYAVLPAFCGHGIGTYFHGPPDIYHCQNDYKGVMLPGMTFTIEPVIGQGSQMIEILEDNWTCVTVDGSRTAQFEHTILITDNGYEILTIPNEDKFNINAN